MFTVLGAVFIVAVGVLVLVFMPKASRYLHDVESRIWGARSSFVIAPPTATVPVAITTGTGSRCDYCGCAVASGSVTCSRCGAPAPGVTS